MGNTSTSMEEGIFLQQKKYFASNFSNFFGLLWIKDKSQFQDIHCSSDYEVPVLSKLYRTVTGIVRKSY